MARRRAAGEGMIRKRADGRWEWRGTMPDGKRVSRYARTQAELLVKRDDVLRRVSEGVSVGQSTTRLADYMARWLSEVAAPSVKPRTIEQYTYLSRRWIVPVLGHVKVGHLGPEHVLQLQNRMLDAGLSPTTVRRARTVLRRALVVAMRWGLISRNPVPLVDAPKQVRPKYRWLSAEEARALIDASRDSRLGPMIVIALNTGIRQGEMLGLVTSAVDLKGRTIRIYQTLQRDKTLASPKSDRERTVPLTDAAVAAFRDWFARYHVLNTMGLVFTSATGAPLRSDTLGHGFRDLLKGLGLPHMRWHDLRHTCASLLLDQGVPMRVIADILGHTDVGVTSNIYAHVSERLGRKSIDMLAAALNPESGQDVVGDVAADVA